MILQYNLSRESLAQENVYWLFRILLIAAVTILQQTHLLGGKELVILIIGPKNIQKQKRTKGLAYRNRGGNSIPAKTFVDIICRCRQKCNQKIPSYEREAAMKTFYSLDSQLAQNIFLRGCIRAKEIKRRRPSNNTKEPRSHSFTYYFRKDKHDIPVCKKYFRDTYQVSDGRIYKCYSKEQVTSLLDQRKGRVASNKIDDTHVVKHIK